MIKAPDHVQVAMPAGEKRGRDFYSSPLGLKEPEKAAALAGRAGAWFALPDQRQPYLVVEKPFEPSRNAHPAFFASSLHGSAATMDAAGSPVRWDDALAPRRRFYGEAPSATGWHPWSCSGRCGDIMWHRRHSFRRSWMGVATIILIIVLVLVVVFAIVTYNGLVRRRNDTEEAYRQIDVQLKRRYDLIPNLLEGVKKYFRQEQEVLKQVTQARSRAMQPQGVGEQARSEARLSGAIGNLFAVAESYPELRSDRVLADFQEELSSTENKISFARQHYNDSVGSYNTKIQSFPAVFFARAMGFTEKEYFEAQGPEWESVTVSYD